MIPVIIESPFDGSSQIILDRNMAYLRAAMRDCLNRGEAPFASHALYTQPGVLRDDVPEEREWGIQAGFKWRETAAYTVVYQDFGVSTGMKYGIEHAQKIGHPVVYRSLPDFVSDLMSQHAADKSAASLVERIEALEKDSHPPIVHKLGTRVAKLEAQVAELRHQHAIVGDES